MDDLPNLNTLLSLAAILISFASYRQSRAGVRVRGGRAGILDNDPKRSLGPALTVTVRTSRSARVTVDYWGFEIRNRFGRRPGGGAASGIGPNSVPRRSGPEYPHTLEPGDPSAVWGMAVSDLRNLVGPKQRLRAYVQISTRERPVRDRPWRLLKVEDFPLIAEIPKDRH
jgi:hypothetical protein